MNQVLNIKKILSNFNKQHMQTPAYPNLTDISSTIKGTMEEILKNHQIQQ